MKNFTFLWLMCSITLIGPSCKKNEPVASVAQQSCDSKGRKVRDVVGENGIVWFNKSEQRYAIHSSIAGTIDDQVIGFVCNELATKFQHDGQKVTFSGTYRESDKQPMAGGVRYYYLELLSIEAQKE